MDACDPLLVGTYVGVKEVWPDRQAELSARERKEIAKGTPTAELILHADGSFFRTPTDGTWTANAERVLFQPIRFGGETLDQMRQRVESLGRAFGLAFVFSPFTLEREGEALRSPDDGGAVMTIYRKRMKSA